MIKRLLPTAVAFIKNPFLTLALLLLVAACVPTRPPAPTEQQRLHRNPHAVIVIDAGHGGHDLGTCSLDQRNQEKSLNLTTALFVRNHLKKLGYRPILLRQRDHFITLQARAAKANRLNATLFVSIHYNSSVNRKAEGIEIFYYPSQASPATRKRSAQSRTLAHTLLSKIRQHAQLPSRGVKEASFFVIRNTKMPAVLVEGGFMTNPQEMAKLRNPRYLNQIALGIAEGIDSFLIAHPHLQVN